MASGPRLRPSDLVAVLGSPGPAWRDLAATCWDAGAALLPVDPRLAPPEVTALLDQARPTLHVEGGRWTRVARGVPASPGTAVIVATSGSRGRPRLVELGRGAVEAAVAGSMTALSADASGSWLCCLPVAHIGGLLVILRSVLTGAPLLVHERFDAGAVGDAVNRGAVGFLSVVPTMVPRLLAVGADLSRLRGLLVGGSAVDPAVRSLLLPEIPAILTYGQTQSCGGVIYNGRPLPGVGLRIATGDEVQLSGDTLMSGYRLDPVATAGSRTADGWLHTGDAGRLSGAGLLEVDGRLDDAIVTGGEKVWPHEVEAVARELSGVADVAVTGRPDPAWGMRVVAHVVPTDAAAAPTLDQLRDFVATRIARFKAPSELVIVSSLPRTALGKIRRSQLSRDERE